MNRGDPRLDWKRRREVVLDLVVASWFMGATLSNSWFYVGGLIVFLRAAWLIFMRGIRLDWRSDGL